MTAEFDSKIRVLVVDDEPLARSNIIALLQGEDSVDCVEQCGSGEEAISLIRTTRPHLVFLDVQMPECDGFDVVELLGSEVPPAVIFVTAFDQHALRAFEAGALDYLLKPFDNSRFWRAFQRARAQIAHGAPGSTVVEGKVERLLVKTVGRTLFLNATDVDWIEAADYYACLHVGAHTHLLRRTMSELETDLSEAVFCRIHRSTIVNLRRVTEITFDRDGEHEVVLTDNTRLRMSRRYHKELKLRLAKLIG
jgi:two-component system LytT family response regulator